MATSPEPWELLRLLADPTRVRLLLLLRREELSVAEIQNALEMGQSRISSHLGLLRQAEIVTDRREGKRTFYRLNDQLTAALEKVVSASLDAAANSFPGDRLGLERVLRKRRDLAEQYFDSIAGRFEGNYCPGRSWEAFAHFLLLLPDLGTVADLGAGEGLISHLLARRCQQVTCVDNSPRMVEVGSELAERNGINNLRYVLGDIEEVPLKDKSTDLAILSQALHHANRPNQAVAEAFRILRPGGRVAILDLCEHTFEKARELYADLWLGFSENQLHQWMRRAGFRQIEINVVSREAAEPGFETLLATGIRP